MGRNAGNLEIPVWDEASLRRPHGQADKARRVRDMFDRIAPAYERVNAFSSLGRDRYWRRRAAELAGVWGDDQVLDVACGTGDFARAFAAAGAGRVVGIDFAGDMLRRATARGAVAGWCQADALRLPFRDGSFSVATCAFGVRNFQNLTAGLAEMHRVLRASGRAVVLEFSWPSNPILGRLYRWYLGRILPRAASWLSGDRSGAYYYLARSVESFVDEEGLEAALRAAGFEEVRRWGLTFGVVHVYLARRGASNHPHPNPLPSREREELETD
jgi:demethylmenaquinone methyltransferase/2-methoxy-6-polyprenyl-1,4-benzoquinol methylase